MTLVELLERQIQLSAEMRKVNGNTALRRREKSEVLRQIQEKMQAIKKQLNSKSYAQTNDEQPTNKGDADIVK